MRDNAAVQAHNNDHSRYIKELSFAFEDMIVDAAYELSQKQKQAERPRVFRNRVQEAFAALR
jgi:hypothetical protein